MSESDLEFMVLDKDSMPPEFQGYRIVREGTLDNQMMAEVFLSGYNREYAIKNNEYRLKMFKDLPKTEANARGKMLIYLLENDLIKV